jgi:hypothetical protein
VWSEIIGYARKKRHGVLEYWSNVLRNSVNFKVLSTLQYSLTPLLQKNSFKSGQVPTQITGGSRPPSSGLDLYFFRVPE